jgi:hypothetical protein
MVLHLGKVVYMLVEQSVHILKFNNLEQLAADSAYEFAYILLTSALRGTVEGSPPSYRNTVRSHTWQANWSPKTSRSGGNRPHH